MRAPRLLLVSGAVVLGLAMIIATEAVIRKETADALGSAERHVETLARSLRDQIDAEFAGVESLMRVTAAEAQREGLEVAALRMSRMIAARSGKAADFLLLDAAGNKVWESRETRLYPEIILEHLQVQSRELPRLHVTPLSRDPDTGAWVMHLSYPVRGGDGEVKGIAMAAINALQLQRSYGEMNLGRGGVLKLLGRDGVLIARVSDESVGGGHDIGGSDWSRPPGRGCNTGVMLGPVDGVRRIGSACDAEVGALLVGVGVHASDAMSGVHANSMRYRIIAVLLVGLLAGGTMIMFALMTRQQLTQAALRRSESRFRALNALGSDWYWETDAEYRLKHVSEGFYRMCGLPPEMLSGRTLWETEGITPVGSDWSGHQATIVRRAPFRDLALRFISPQAVVAYGSVSGEPVFDENGRLEGYRGIGNDITAEINLRRRLRMQHDVTRILSQGHDTGSTMREVIETICRTMDWKWGARRHLEPGTQMLTCHEYWLAPDCSADEFIALSMQPKISDPRAGTVSQAILQGKIVWLTDHSPLNLRRSRLAREAGLRGAVSVPVRRGRGIEDALEFFSDRVEVPDQVTLDTLDSVSSEVGQFLDRNEAQIASSHLQRERQHLLERLELQLQHMPVACLLQDGDFRLLYCNPAAERMFGYALNELQGRDVAELIVPEALRSRVWARRARLQAGDTAVSGTNENIRKDGVRIICDWNNTPLSDESGGFAGVLATAQDVTERMKMVAALEESEKRYRQIFESAPLPMWVAETAIPRFLAVNDAMVARYGYSREQLLKMSAVDLQVDEDRERVGRQLLNRDPAVTAHFERRHLTRDGRVLLVEITAQPFEFAGKPARLVVALDVTDRRMAQAALQESETRFRAVFEQASVGIAIRELTERPRFLRVNRKLCEILGYPESELLQKTTTELTVDEDLDSTVQMNRQLMSGGITSYSRRKRYRRKDGTPIWVNLSVSRLADGGEREKTGYLISVIEDVSEQVASEARVLESEARYRQLFALTPLPMYLRDEDTLEFLEVNDACLALYGYSRDEMLAMNLIGIQTPENRGRYLGALNRPVGIVEHLQKKHVRKSGETFDVEIYSYPTTLAGRKVRLVLVRDMTDQMRMERLLRDNEARLRAIADNVPAVIAFFDDVRQLQYSNLAFDRWFGTEHAGKPRYGESLHPLLERALRGEDVVNEIVLDTLAGKRVVRMTLIPHRGEDGAVVGVHLMGYDLTDFRHAEAEVRHLNAELERRVEQRTRALAAANRELESFSYSVSHDLRAPLRTIDGFSQILLDEYATKLDETGRGYLERVRAGSQRMAKLIDDLLELARVTRRDLQIRDCDLSALALDIARDLAHADPARRVKVDVAKGMIVAADSGLLRIALDNLLRNAWKFTGLRQDAVIEVGCAEGGAGVTYFVRDNGVGFDMAYANKLFGAFQRLHSESEFQGTGIGLALVQRVIRRHGGNVWAEAEPGMGATFYFTLPAQSAAETAEALQEPVRAGA
jgi:PAS domain S-box-containing protein